MPAPSPLVVKPPFPEDANSQATSAGGKASAPGDIGTGIVFACPSCSKKLRAPDTMAGRNANCTRCGARIVVPGTVSQEVISLKTQPQSDSTDGSSTENVSLSSVVGDRGVIVVVILIVLVLIFAIFAALKLPLFSFGALAFGIAIASFAILGDYLNSKLESMLERQKARRQRREREALALQEQENERQRQKEIEHERWRKEAEEREDERQRQEQIERERRRKEAEESAARANWKLFYESKTMQDVSNMTGREFEQFLARLYSAMGYTDISLTPINDQGGDLVCTAPTGSRVVI
jgi:DNA-directed RNA polymerase subunit RPC12/RpoP